jgi:hypothetical protein
MAPKATGAKKRHELDFFELAGCGQIGNVIQCLPFRLSVNSPAIVCPSAGPVKLPDAAVAKKSLTGDGISGEQ